LRREFLHMLISYMREDGEEAFQDGNYLEHPMLQRGLLWGIGRLCLCKPEEMLEQQIVQDIEAYLDSPDEYVSGLAVWCLGILEAVPRTEKTEKYLVSDFKIDLFLDNQIQTKKVSQLTEILFKRVGC
jgi:hypothetical protein